VYVLFSDSLKVSQETIMSHPRDRLTDEAWAKIAAVFPKRTRPAAGRQFLEACFFKARTGIPWRDLPERFGPWTTIYTRFERWSRRGFFAAIANVLQEEVGMDLSEASLDSTSVKLHASAHGVSKKTLRPQPKASRKAAGTPKSMR
jgi:transposase